MIRISSAVVTIWRPLPVSSTQPIFTFDSSSWLSLPHTHTHTHLRKTPTPKTTLSLVKFIKTHFSPSLCPLETRHCHTLSSSPQTLREFAVKRKVSQCFISRFGNNARWFYVDEHFLVFVFLVPQVTWFWHWTTNNVHHPQGHCQRYCRPTGWSI